MKKHLLFFVVSILCLSFIALEVSASDNVDNTKYLPKVITTDTGYEMVFDSELARIARRMSSDSYGIAIDSNVQDISKTFQEEGFEDVRQSHLFDEPFMGAFSNNFLVGVKTFNIDNKEKHILAIAFRGTQVKDGFDYADLFTDASILGTNGFHSGFYAAALKAYDTLYDIEFPSLKNEDGTNMKFSDYLTHSGVAGSDYYILITGHSLGGAVANIFAGDIISQFGKSNIMCYTFASPIVCSPTKSKEYDAYNIFNIINTNDIVPNVGYNLFAGVRLGNDLKVTVTGSEEGAHNLSVTYEYAINKVISNIESLCPYAHRICTSIIDEVHIHTDCSLERKRFHGNLGSSNLIVTANVTQLTDIKVSGDFDLNSVCLDNKGYRLTIGGNFTNAGTLKMENDDCYIVVEGDYKQNKTQTSSDYITAGTLEIKGNITNGSGYIPTGTHKTILSGDTYQAVDNYYNGTYGNFNILEIRNTSEEGIAFIGGGVAGYNISDNINQPIGTKITNSGYVKLQNKTAFVDYGELNSQINIYNGNAENVIPTWLDYERYCNFALNGDKAFILNQVISDTTFDCDLYFSNDYNKTSAVVIVAFYSNDNCLVQIKAKPTTVKSDKIDFSIDFENITYSKCKVMIWESFDNLIPLSSAFEF